MRRQCVPPRGASRGPRHQPTQIRRPATRGGEELQPQPEPPRRHRCPAAVAHLAAPPIIDRGGIYRPGLSLGHGGGAGESLEGEGGEMVGVSYFAKTK